MAQDQDVVVIGAGVAGALVAWKLASAGCRVLIIDAGESRLEESDRRSFVKTFAEAAQSDKTPSEPYVDPDNSKFAHSPDVADFKLFQPGDKQYYVQDGPDAFKSQYQRLVGGSTWAWRGNCPRFIPSDFKLKTQHGVAEDWPISYDDLEPWYCDAEDALGVAGDHQELHNLFGAYRSREFPMDKIAQAYGDLQVKQALGETVFDGVRIRVTALPQARNSRPYDGRPACHGNSNCIPLCPIQAKYDASAHVRKAIQAGAKLVDRAVVTELALDGNGNIAQVRYRTWDGEEHRAAGKIVILAAHAVESVKILLMSNQGKGIANSSDQVGRNLMDHLGGEGCALMPFQVFPFRGPQSTSGIDSFRDHQFRDQRCAFRMTVGNDGWGRTKHPYDTLKDLTDRKLFGEELQRQLFDTVSRQLRIAYSAEQLPEQQNRVTLSGEKDDVGIPKPRITYKIGDYSRNGMQYAQTVIKHIFTELKAPQHTWDFTDLKGPRYFSGSGHIMGTCRMGNDPQTSVVDPDCRSHDHKNLFIVGSSVFTTGGTANPTVTLAALALRTANSVQKQLRATVAVAQLEGGPTGPPV